MFQSKNYLESLVNLSCCLQNGQWENGGKYIFKMGKHERINDTVRAYGIGIHLIRIYACGVLLLSERQSEKKCIEMKAHILCETSSSIWMWQEREKKNILLLFNWLILYFAWLVERSEWSPTSTLFLERTTNTRILYLSCCVNWNGNSCQLRCAWCAFKSHHK